MMILFVLDHLKTDMFIKDNSGNVRFVFSKTTTGRILYKMLTDKKKGLGLNDNDYDITFAYQAIPKVLGKKKYKPITKTEGKPYYLKLRHKIVVDKPDLIVPMGNVSLESVINRRGINNLRGLPRHETITWTDKDKKEYSHTCWVLPTLSVDNVLVDKNKEGLLNADFTVIEKYINQGEQAFEAKPVGYELVTDYDRVIEIFEKVIPKQKLVAWDLETNTLRPEMVGHIKDKKTGKMKEVKAKVLDISLSWKEGQGCTIPLEHREVERKQLWSPGELRQIYYRIEEFLRNKDIIKVGHNIQFDMHYLYMTHGFNRFNSCYDTKVFHYLAISQDPKTSRELSILAYQYTDMGGYDHPLEEYKKRVLETHEWLFRKVKQLHDRKLYKKAGKKYLVKDHPYQPLVNPVDGDKFCYDWIPLKVLYPYAAGDVDCCLRIANKFLSILKKDKPLYKLATQHYPELEDALAWIEGNGMPVDMKRAEKLDKAYVSEMGRLRQEIRTTIPEVRDLEEEKQKKLSLYLEEMKKKPAERDKKIVHDYKKYASSGVEYNPSPNATDNGEVLYRLMGYELPYDKKYVKETPWTNNKKEEDLGWQDYKVDTKGALPYLIDTYNCELAKLLMKYSKASTLHQNFTGKLPKLVGADNRVHGNFNITGTETSRLSSSHPNLQNVPRHIEDANRFDYRYPVKSMFTTSYKKGALLNVDFASLEAHIMGLFAHDDTMTQGFIDGEDVHKNTASIMYGVPIDEVTGDQRSDAKKITFGIAYGQQTATLAKNLGISKEDAERKVDMYFKSKPKIKQSIDYAHAFLDKHGYVRTMQGFKRNLRTVHSTDRGKKAEAYRESFNTIIQGTGAFLTNRSLVYIKRYILDNGMKSRIIATVHDSILIDSPNNEIRIMAQVVPYIMCNLPIDFLKINWKGKEMNYPIGAEVDIGINYNDMVRYDDKDFVTFNSPEGYVSYYHTLEDLENKFHSKVVTEDQYNKAIDLVKKNKSYYQVV